MNDERLHHLIDEQLEGSLSASGQSELAAMLRASAAARRIYWEFVNQDALLREVVQESAGRDLARMAAKDLSMERPSPELPSAEAGPPSSYLRLWLTASAILLAAVVVMAIVGVPLWSRLLPRPAVPEGDPIASLRSLTGEVWVSPGKERAVSGQQFYAGDTLRLGEEAQAVVVLADGSRVELGANSEMVLSAAGDPSERRVHLERGAADIEAAPQPPDKPLILSTRQVRLVVLGTRFRLYAGTHDSRVELEEGSVSFQRQSDGESVEVTAGQYAVAETSAGPSQPLIAQSLGDDWRLCQTLLRAGGEVTFSHDGAMLATSSSAGIKVWNLEMGKPVHTLKATCPGGRLAFTASNDQIVALNEEGQALYWQIGAPSTIQRELTCAEGALRRCAVSPSGRWLAQTTSAAAGHLAIWKVDDSGEISFVRSIPQKTSNVALAETAAGPIVAASQWDGTTLKWDVASGRELMRHRCQAELFGLALSADARMLAGYSHKDGLLLIGAAAKPQVLWPGGSVRANCVRFARDGEAVFAAMDDGVVRAWSAADGKPLLVISTGDTRLTALALSTDGDWLATAGDGGNVKIWQRKGR